MVLAIGRRVIKLERDAVTGACARTCPHMTANRFTPEEQAHRLIVTTADALVADHLFDTAALVRERPDLVIGIIESFDGCRTMKVSSRRGSPHAGVWRQRRRYGPVFSAVQVATHATAQSVAAGVIAALYARESTAAVRCSATTLAHGLLPYEMGGLPAAQLQARGSNCRSPPSIRWR
jgi:hypothetical protein